jgi:hypothetical protein
MSNPFDYVNQIMQGKKNLIVDEVTENEYNPFLTNRSLSYHFDCVLYANEMNRRHHTDKKMQYDFFINTVRSKKRPFAKWVKNEKSEDLQCVKQYFAFSDSKANEALSLLSDEDIKTIREKTDIGGIRK